jgi:hypothetical protein
MGQYQQWLHYQEVDRRLRAELETLETELAHLQDSMHEHPQVIQLSSNGEIPHEQPALQMHNLIIRLLASGLNQYASTGQAGNTFSNNPLMHSVDKNGVHEQVVPLNHDLTSTGEDRPFSNGETISAALMSRGRLPNFGPPESQEASSVIEQHGEAATPHPEIVLLPEDMQAFFDEHFQTDPQHEIPWWLRNVAPGAPVSIDPESMRTDRLVQRWIERRRQLSPQPPDAPAPVKPEEVTDDE